jgi:hypothetical protein
VEAVRTRVIGMGMCRRSLLRIGCDRSIEGPFINTRIVIQIYSGDSNQWFPIRFLSEPDIAYERKHIVSQAIDQVGSNILLCIRRRLVRGKDRRASQETIEYLLALFAQVVTQYVISFSNLVRVTQFVTSFSNLL